MLPLRENWKKKKMGKLSLDKFLKKVDFDYIALKSDVTLHRIRGPLEGDSPTLCYPIMHADKTVCAILNDAVLLQQSKGDCKPVSTNADNVCNLVSGATDYFTYKWTDDKLHYITSMDDFNSIQGWANPVQPGYLRELIEESGNNNPEDCDLALWNQCGEMITAAEVNCQSCGSSDASDRSNLECEGCLFRELNPDGTWDPASSTNNWHTCCPCVAHYAENVEKVWLKHSVKNC